MEELLDKTFRTCQKLFEKSLLSHVRKTSFLKTICSKKGQTFSRTFHLLKYTIEKVVGEHKHCREDELGTTVQYLSQLKTYGHG